LAKLGLGTVQFGLNYGISNTVGQTPEAEVAEILQLAAQRDVQVLDTAAGYGDSEDVLGQTLQRDHLFRIVTKTPALDADSAWRSPSGKLIQTFQQSLIRLQQSQVYGLLIHRVADLFAPAGVEIWEAMQDLQHQGLVQKIGASIYTGEDLNSLLAQFTPDLVQLPINVFDQRLLQSGHLQRLKQLDVEIHARSVFLQGLLLMEPEQLPESLHHVSSKLASYRKFIAQGGLSPLAAAYGFVSQIPEIDCVLVGVNTVQQFQEILNVAQGLQAFDPQDFQTFSCTDPTIVNPATWR